MNEQKAHSDLNQDRPPGGAAPSDETIAGQTEPAESDGMEHVAPVTPAERPASRMASDDTTDGNPVDAGEATAEDVGAEQTATSAEADTDAESDTPDTPSERHDRGELPQQTEEGEPPSSRVLIQAGTDEASLKALALCQEKVKQLRLRMHPLAARWENERHVVIFFRADEKVDFRKLVRELSRVLHARIELRQLGPREQGKLCGLVGKCGYPLCCQTFLAQFAQSTIKMAKTQDLALNPMKISGVCGRLLCCLNYEQGMYLDTKSRLPRVNKIVQTEFGPGRVAAINVLKETVTVQYETMTRELRPDQIRAQEEQS